MGKTKGSIKVSLCILAAAAVVYYGEWFRERRAAAPPPLAPFRLSSGYWTNVTDEAERIFSSFDTLSRSYSMRWYTYRGKEGEKVLLSLSFISDVAPIVHCYLWNRITLVDRGGTRVGTGVDDPAEIQAREILVDSGEARSLCLHWYMGMETAPSNFFMQQVAGLKRRLLSPGKRVLLVRAAAPVGEGSEDDARETVSRFIRDAFPDLKEYGKSEDGERSEGDGDID